MRSRSRSAVRPRSKASARPRRFFWSGRAKLLRGRRRNEKAARRPPVQNPCKDVRGRLLGAADRLLLALLLGLGLLLGLEVLAGRLIHDLHRQARLAALVQAEQLYLHLVAFLDHVLDVLHAARRELADVHEAVLGAEEVHEGAE